MILKHFNMKTVTVQNYEQSGQKMGQFLEMKYFENQSFQNISIIKVGLLILHGNSFFRKIRPRLKNDFEYQNFAIFKEFIIFVKSEDDLI